jgi:hypothetical protein
MADIGVVGLGNCKTSLKCPAHKTIHFPAYFYELENEKHLATPYVGNIDLDGLMNESKNCYGYRLPSQGHLQIIIKNQSKTPIKVFLIPYDFSDMPQGSKTFIRQKTYVSSSASKGKVDALQGLCHSKSQGSSLNERLGYAIHLQVVCLEKKRMFLTRSIRVVFSHRTPEKDEFKRVVSEGPVNPKYTLLESPLRSSFFKPIKSRRYSLGSTTPVVTGLCMSNSDSLTMEKRNASLPPLLKPSAIKADLENALDKGR